MFAATINTIFSEKITLNVGDAAPQFTLENQDGVFEELSDYILFGCFKCYLYVIYSLSL